MDDRDSRERGYRCGRKRFRTERTTRPRRSRSPTLRRSHTPDRIQRLELLVDRLPGNANLSSSKWLDKIAQLGKINQWDNNTKIYHMQNRLKGLAKTWYNNLNSYAYTWKEWKELVQKTFPEHHDFATTLKALVARVKEPRETMIQYYFSKLKLLQAWKITSKDAVSCFINGLQDRTLRHGAIAGRYETPENLFTDYLSTITNDTPKDNTQNESQYQTENKGRFDRRRLGSKKRSRPFNERIQRTEKTQQRLGVLIVERRDIYLLSALNRNKNVGNVNYWDTIKKRADKRRILISEQ